MTYSYELAVADKMYSSWSLRGWLLFEAFGIPYKQHTAFMRTDGFHEMLAAFKPARALARSVTAEMHSGFTSLRGDCPMNLRHSYPDFKPSDAVLADVARITDLWTQCRETFGADSPWLFGKYSIADAFYAPAATRLATYHLPQSEQVADYVATTLADTTFRRWRAMAFAQNYVQEGYDLELSPTPWPAQSTLKATPIDTGPSENELCPYSGKATTDYLEIEGRVFGFCNPFCRDKTVADPEAWEKFVAIYQK